MKNLVFGLTLTLVSSLAFAASPAWNSLAGGEHSFKTLGKDFYVDVPVKRIENAQVKLAFVNRALAKQLGLELPEDPKEIEAMLVDLFAWEVDPTGQSPKKWFATHYLDSAQKGPGNAMGDGRALWTGELVLKRPDGKLTYIDSVEKGVGITPFAWLNNKGHNDGKQSPAELVYSGIQSMAAAANQLDATGDLIGFAIFRNGEWKTQTVRLGRQTRPAHIAYFSDNAAQERKMMDYIVRRDLGLPIDAKVDRERFLEWERQFALQNAEETARMYDLLAIQESPTKGNKTTTGGSIDLAGVRYFDAYHTDFKHLFGRLSVGEQVSYQRSYIGMINSWLSAAKYPHMKMGLTNEMQSLFDRRFTEVASRLRLARLGLSEEDIGKVPKDLRLEFFKAADAIQRAKSTKKKIGMHPGNGEGINPAAFDVRSVLAGTMKAIADGNSTALENLFHVEGYAWADPSADNSFVTERTHYLEVALKIVDRLGGVNPAWITNAERMASKRRFDQTTGDFWSRYEDGIVKSIAAGADWTDVTSKMEEGAKTLIDRGLPRRDSRVLAPVMRPAARTCSEIFSIAG